MERESWDAIIVGGGPAGLSAALVLGRCRRTVLVCDAGHPRNERATELHAFPTRDGLPPGEFLDLVRADLERYPTVRVWRGPTVVSARKDNRSFTRKDNRSFTVTLDDGRTARGRKLLLATGVRDELPKLPDVDDFYGRSVHHCPYCDGWEARDQPLAIYGRRNRAFEMARAMTAWSDDLVLCTNGASGLQVEQKRQLSRNGVRLIEERIVRLVGTNGQLEAILFEDDRRLPRRHIFFDMPSHGATELPRQLGCRIKRDGSVHCSGYEATDVPGVFIAGNIVGDVQLVVVAAAEGAKAAFGINLALTREDFELSATGRRIVEHPTQSAD
jgi:thioredoxin reductase